MVKRKLNKNETKILLEINNLEGFFDPQNVKAFLTDNGFNIIGELSVQAAEYETGGMTIDLSEHFGEVKNGH